MFKTKKEKKRRRLFTLGGLLMSGVTTGGCVLVYKNRKPLKRKIRKCLKLSKKQPTYVLRKIK